jgi:ATP-binding cassette subfamily B protein
VSASTLIAHLPAIREPARVRLRVLRLLVAASPALTATAVLFVLAEGVLPNLVIVAMGRATGEIPAAVRDGLDSAAGTRLLVALAIAGAVYALSLLRGPAEDALAAAVRSRMTIVLQRRVVDAVATPTGIAHLEDPKTHDLLASATGEVRGDRAADAPMTLLSLWGDRLTGLVACGVLMTFRWWAGLLLAAVWLAVRRPARAFVVSRVTTFRHATGSLRQAGYLLGLASGGPAAKEVRVFGLAGWLVERYRERWLAAMGPSWRELGAIDRRIARIALLVLAAYLVCAGALGDAALTGAIGLGTLATMLPMLAMSMQLGTVSAVDVAVESMLAAVPDLDTLPERLAVAPAAGALDAGDRPVRAVRFEAVRFRYPVAAADVLRGVDLTLEAGVSHALVGANGAGKTTLVALLAGLHAPTGGRLAVDDVALGELDARAWQQRIAVVSQDALYLPLSARENVTLAGLRGAQVDEAALAHAAHQAGADAVVAGLAHGWDTVLSPRYPGGTELSGGQWQRIVLARALYAVARGARILVFDEPTAPLDVRAEAAFHDRFLELTAGTTSVVISHRFSTVRRAARIAVLEDGVITELGDHATLMAAGGRYAELYELQAAAFREPA